MFQHLLTSLRLFSVSVTLAVLAALYSSAHADVIDFENITLSEGELLESLPGVTFSGAILAIEGAPLVAFLGSGPDTVTDQQFGGQFITNEGALGPGGTIEINFDPSVQTLSFLAADIDGGEVLEARVFDSAGNVLETVSITLGTPSSGDNVVTPVAFASQDIAKLTVSIGGGSSLGWGLDHLQFTTASPEAAEIPHCHGMPATLVGTPNDDTLLGTPGDDVIVGLAGNDIIKGRGGHDLICGNAGNDHIDGGRGDDKLIGGRGDDILRGGTGDDILKGGADHDVLRGGNGMDTLEGSRGNDDLRGDGGDDYLYGQAGNDTLRGGSGDDELRGGHGDDRLHGNSGNDKLRGDWGTNDLCRGGPGRDTARGCEQVSSVP